MAGVTLEDGFEDKAEQAILEQAEQWLRDEIGPALKQLAQQNWQNYAARNGYDIDHVWEDTELTVERDGDSIDVQIEWPGLTALFEFGVAPHTIEGDPLLHFYWEEIGEWVTAESVEWGSETGGIPEARAIRDALNQIRRVMQ